jgi:hypothetical protein
MCAGMFCACIHSCVPRYGRRVPILQAKRIVNKPRVNEEYSLSELRKLLDLRNAEIEKLKKEVCLRGAEGGLFSPCGCIVVIFSGHLSCAAC